MQNHNITINGGTEIVKYFLSMGVLDQDGMYDNINYKAYKFRSNVDAPTFQKSCVSVLVWTDVMK